MEGNLSKKLNISNVLYKRINDEFQKIKHVSNLVIYDDDTIYNLEELWQLHTENGFFNVALERINVFEYNLFIGYTIDSPNNYTPVIINQCEYMRNQLNYIDFFQKNSIKYFPIEVNNIIFSFLIPKKVIFQFNLKNDKEYPFVPSTVTLRNQCYFAGCSENEKLKQIFAEIIEKSICMRNEGWSPALTLEKQILSFIVDLRIEQTLFLLNSSN